MEALDRYRDRDGMAVHHATSQHDKMLVVLDDDKFFLRTLSRAALKHRLICIGCENVEDFFEATMYFSNAVILIDQNLGLSKHLFNRPRYYQKGDQLLGLIDSQRVYLMSADPKALLVAMEHPDRIKGFISKEIGVTNIIKFVTDIPLSRAK